MGCRSVVGVFRLGLVFALGLALASACKGKDDEDCARTRSEDRSDVLQPALVFRRAEGAWKAEKLLTLRKYSDRAAHLTASGRVELYENEGGKLLLSAAADGPGTFEDALFGSAGEKLEGGALLAAKEKLLEGREFLLRLPEIPVSGASGREKALETLRRARVLKWIPEGESGKEDRAELTVELGSLPLEDSSADEKRRPDYVTPEGLESDLPLEAVHWSGDPRSRLNLVILPDGFTREQLPEFRAKVKELVDALLTRHSPYRDYRSLLNVIRVDVPSKESGADCEDGKYSPRKTRYGSAFPVACLNAAVGTKFNDRFVYQLGFSRVNHDSSAIRFQGVSVADEVFVLVNSPKYGGAAIAWANQTLGAGWNTAAHELGHSWGRLADEYVVEGDLCHIYMASSRNMSFKVSSDRKLKWKEWTVDGTPLPTPDEAAYDGVVGLFQGGAGGCKKALYRPMHTCKMRSSGQAFCPVCEEQMILRLYDRASLIDGPIFRVGGSAQANVPALEGLRTRWYVDGDLVWDAPGYNPYSALPEGRHHVKLLISDERAPVRRDRCDLVFSREGFL